MIKKIISGGQTGADQGGLFAGKSLGIPTGGIAPKGYRTETGNNVSLKTIFSLKEHSSYSYPPRTELNITMSDATIVFGPNTGGSKLTRDLCFRHEKALFNVFNTKKIDPILVEYFRNWINENNIEVLNVAGSRESKVPGITDFVVNFLVKALEKRNNGREKRKNLRQVR